MHGSQLVSRSHIIGSGDAVGRTASGTDTAADALVRIDVVFHQVLADMGRALLVNDVSDIFISEVGNSGIDRVGSGLA